MGYRQGLYNIVCLYSGVLHNDSIYVYIVKLAPQPCPTLCHPMDCSLPGSSAHGILQNTGARILEWVATSCSRGSPPPRDRTQVSCIAGRFFTN